MKTFDQLFKKCNVCEGTINLHFIGYNTNNKPYLTHLTHTHKEFVSLELL